MLLVLPVSEDVTTLNDAAQTLETELMWLQHDGQQPERQQKLRGAITQLRARIEALTILEGCDGATRH